MAVSLRELGDQIRSAREDARISQDELAHAIGGIVNRSQIAHVEQGRRVPSPEALEAIAKQLAIPTKYWKPFTDPDNRERLEFEEALSELVGRPMTLRFLDEHSDSVAGAAITAFFGTPRSAMQTLDSLNSILVFYNVKPTSASFFERYLGVECSKSPGDFLKCVRRFQSEAIRLFSTITAAYESLNGARELEQHLSQLMPRDVAPYHNRLPWNEIEEIPEERLPDLGYISAQKAKRERNEREILARFLDELARDISREGKAALLRHSEKKRRKMSSLLRLFDSRLEHDFISPLFIADADVLGREAAWIAPKEDKDLDRIAETQAMAQRNLARYLAADHLDMYVATSMRTDADFVSVNRFVKTLFAHPDVKPLNIRYFNPTQSWIEDRVAKGLVEALMLRRATVTIYMAQKGDTFGKDSEASVALGQGKPVIVYVPKLLVNRQIDSEQIGVLSRAELETFLAREGSADDKEADPTMDQDALVARLLTVRLERLDPKSFPDIVRAHWADFDLYGEDARIEDVAQRAEYRSWLDDVVKKQLNAPVPVQLLPRVIGILVAVAIRFEGRAKVFRDVHPLALQVILSTGVLNGILVARSVESCATLIEALLKNQLDFDLQHDEDNYRLIERGTRSTARVVSRHTLITNAFAAFYSTQHPEQGRPDPIKS